jgi:hypothetical protein
VSEKDLKTQFVIVGVFAGVYLLLANTFGAGFGLFLMLIFGIVLYLILDVVLLLLRNLDGNVRGGGLLGVILAVLVRSFWDDE